MAYTWQLFSSFPFRHSMANAAGFADSNWMYPYLYESTTLRRNTECHTIDTHMLIRQHRDSGNTEIQLFWSEQLEAWACMTCSSWTQRRCQTGQCCWWTCQRRKFLIMMLPTLMFFVIIIQWVRMTCMGLSRRSSKFNIWKSCSAEGTVINH